MTVTEEMVKKTEDLNKQLLNAMIWDEGMNSIIDIFIAALPDKIPIDQIKPWQDDIKQWANDHNRLIDRITGTFEKAKEL